MRKSKKAQITIFVVLGIILLFSSILIFVIRNQISTANTDYAGNSAEAPFEIMPIKLMVETCIEKVTIDALKKIGQQGGYIDLPGANIGVADDSFFLDSASSDSIRFAPGLDWKIPYYWYMKSSNRCTNCLFDSKKPDLNTANQRSIKSQLENYIDTNLPLCFDASSVEQTTGKQVNILSAPVSEVIIAKDDLVIGMSYPMTIVDNSNDYDMESFYVKLPVKLKKIYDLANQISNDEINEHYFENQLMDLITILGGLNNPYIPPVKETVFELSDINYWMKSEVKVELQNVLSTYIPVFQIVGSKNAAYFNPENLLQQGLYNRFNRFVNLSDYNDISDLNVDFLYFGDLWPMYLDVQGRGVRGEFIGPEMATISYVPMGIQRYYFYYQASFPVVVKLSDDSPIMKSIFGDEGFVYYFALEANLRDNKPIDVDYEEQNSTTILTDTLCDVYHKTSGAITFNITDYVTGLPIEKSLVNFDLGRGQCMVAVTKNTTTTTKMNTGMGYLVVSHPKYLDSTTRFSLGYNESRNVSVQLMPYKEVPIIVKKYPSVKSSTGWSLRDVSSDYVRNEVALITLDKVRTSASDPDYSYTTIYEYNKPTKVRLVPGEYEVSIYSMQRTPYRGDDKIVIEEATMRIPSSNPFGSGDEITLPEIEFNSTFPEGETMLNNYTGSWVVDADTLYSSNNITFFSITAPGMGLDALTHQDLEELGKNEDYVLENRDKIEPVFG